MAIWVFHRLELAPSHSTLGYSPVHLQPGDHPPDPTMPCSFDASCLCVGFSLPLLLGNCYFSYKVPPTCICPWETSPWHPGRATRPAFGCLLPRTTFYHSRYHTSGQLCLCPALFKCSDQVLLVSACEPVPRAGWLPWLPVRFWGGGRGGRT